MQFEKWKQLITSNDVLERVEAADNLPEEVSVEMTTPYLLKTLYDKEVVVRICSAGSLRYVNDQKVQQALREFIQHETDSLALAYGFSSLGSIGTIEDIMFLMKTLQNKTKAQIIKTHILFGLLLGTQKLFYDQLIFLLKSNLDDMDNFKAIVAQVTATKEILLEQNDNFQNIGSTLRILIDQADCNQNILYANIKELLDLIDKIKI